MRYLLLFTFTIFTAFTNAQQVNPVTDYTFANKMSAGRSTVTDTAAYFSVGPRFGAIRGMMPPMVVDTAVVVANKRNGLLIFSVQRNKFLVWDSAGSKWADMTGAAGSAITSADTAAMLLPYLRKADTTFLSDRINLKVNISDTSTMLTPYVRGSGTANYLPKFNASRSIIDSKVYETGTNLMFNTITPYISSSGYGSFDINGSTASLLVLRKTDTARGYWSHNGATMDINNLMAGDIRFYTNAQLRGRFQTDGTFRLNSLTGTGTRSVVADANGVLSATSSATGLVDTTVLSTRAWRQKGDDSLGAIIATKVNISDTATMLTNYIRHAGNGLTKNGQALSVDTAAMATRARVQKAVDSLNGVIATKGSGTVTSVATGYGLSGGTITTTGTIIVDSAIVASRLRVGKVVDSLALVKQNVLTNPVTGTGTTNYVPKFTGTSTIGNSLIYDNGGVVLINTTTIGSNGLLQINGDVGISGARQIRPASNFDSDALTFLGTKLTIGRLNSDAYGYSGSGLISSTTNLDGALLFDAGRRSGTTIGRVQISNTTSENVALSVLSGSTTTFLASSNSETYINTTTDAGDYKLQVSGNAYVTGTTVLAASSGGLGVGVTPQTWGSAFKFMQIGTGGAVWGSTSATELSIGGNAKVDPTNAFYQYINNGFATHYQQVSGTHTWFYAGSGSAGGTISFTEAMEINTNGELLLNNASDAGDYKLQVSGNAYVYNASAGSAVVSMMGGARAGALGLKIFNETIAQSTIIALGEESGTSSTPFFIRRYGSGNANASAVEIVNGQNAAMWLSTNSTERIRLHANGGLKFVGQSAAPTAEAGTVYYDTDDNKLKVYNGTTWVDLH